MAIYKCKDCTHEENYSYNPLECSICGGFRIVLIEGGLGKITGVNSDLFSSSRFCLTIQDYCSQIGWKVKHINDSRAILKFEMDSGITQTLFIIRYDNTLEFSCPSGIQFDDLEDFPHKLSTFLITKNAEYKFGFWCVEKISNKYTFSMMHNAEISLIDVKYFSKVIYKLIQECDNFEQSLREVINS